jgi:hypothetical protein
MVTNGKYYYALDEIKIRKKFCASSAAGGKIRGGAYSERKFAVLRKTANFSFVGAVPPKCCDLGPSRARARSVGWPQTATLSKIYAVFLEVARAWQNVQKSVRGGELSRKWLIDRLEKRLKSRKFLAPYLPILP